MNILNKIKFKNKVYLGLIVVVVIGWLVGGLIIEIKALDKIKKTIEDNIGIEYRLIDKYIDFDIETKGFLHDVIIKNIVVDIDKLYASKQKILNIGLAQIIKSENDNLKIKLSGVTVGANFIKYIEYSRKCKSGCTSSIIISRDGWEGKLIYVGGSINDIVAAVNNYGSFVSNLEQRESDLVFDFTSKKGQAISHLTSFFGVGKEKINKLNISRVRLHNTSNYSVVVKTDKIDIKSSFVNESGRIYNLIINTSGEVEKNKNTVHLVGIIRNYLKDNSVYIGDSLDEWLKFGGEFSITEKKDNIYNKKELNYTYVVKKE